MLLPWTPSIPTPPYRRSSRSARPRSNPCSAASRQGISCAQCGRGCVVRHQGRPRRRRAHLRAHARRTAAVRAQAAIALGAIGDARAVEPCSGAQGAGVPHRGHEGLPRADRPPAVASLVQAPRTAIRRCTDRFMASGMDRRPRRRRLDRPSRGPQGRHPGAGAGDAGSTATFVPWVPWSPWRLSAGSFQARAGARMRSGRSAGRRSGGRPGRPTALEVNGPGGSVCVAPVT